mmetsp:Transcript_29141/g.78167  ORF Transcript_29141/g.78167 Transcript_29141/m.78167 type:complete len:209 (-) Transcript_29141:392-1018(-)
MHCDGRGDYDARALRRHRPHCDGNPLRKVVRRKCDHHQQTEPKLPGPQKLLVVCLWVVGGWGSGAAAKIQGDGRIRRSCSAEFRAALVLSGGVGWVCGARGWRGIGWVGTRARRGSHATGKLCNRDSTNRGRTSRFRMGRCSSVSGPSRSMVGLPVELAHVSAPSAECPASADDDLLPIAPPLPPAVDAADTPTPPCPASFGMHRDRP